MKNRTCFFRRFSLLPATILFALIIGVGCSSTSKMSKQLARVAKDWSLAMRASQIIPVYPLTEDLKPGDVFLVQTRIEEQVAEFEANGFLPLDKHIARLTSTDYTNFYEGAYGLAGENTTTPPYLWSTPLSETNLWRYAPGAAFPSYSFEFKRGGGLSVALPVQGVPIGLGLMGMDSAYGSITIKEGLTYGLSEELMLRAVTTWVRRQPEILTLYAPTESRTNYLRVVNRVFLAREVNVLLTKASAGGFGASGGAGRDVNLFDLNNTNALQNYTNLLDQLNKLSAASATPGGALKVASATSRSISMEERFRRPLVIGYLSMEFPILGSGELGTPFSTFRALTKKGYSPNTARLFAYDAEDPNASRIMAWVTVRDAQGRFANQDKLIAWLLDNEFKVKATREIPMIAAAPQYRELRKRIVTELIEQP